MVERNAGRFIKLLSRETADPSPVRERSLFGSRGASALGEERGREVIAMTERAIISKASPQARDSGLAEKTLADARRAVNKMTRDGAGAALTPDEALAAEAIVIADGTRPAIEMRENKLDLSDPNLSHWSTVLPAHKAALEETASSIGRIDLGGVHCGTGFVIADSLILTNRHVLDVIGRFDDGVWKIASGATISFAADGGGSAFPVSSVALAGDDLASGGLVDFNRLDFAVLRFQADTPPPKLTLADDVAVPQRTRPVTVCGYPGKPLPGQYDFSVLMDLFNLTYGVKRLSPGEVDLAVGELTEDTRETVFAYDCTTLGGNSGSPVLDLGAAGAAVVGLHFSGSSNNNFGHAVSRFLSASQIAALAEAAEDH